MTNIRSASFLAALVALPTLSFAGTPEKKMAPAPEKINESAITGDIGLNVVSAYYSRGQNLQKHSASFQPYTDIFLKAYEGDGFLNKAVFTMGLWESFTNPATVKNSTNPAVKGSTTAAWYEADFMPGVALTFGKVTITESYFYFESPNDSFGTFQGLNSRIAYDDSDLLGAWALHPAITNLHEISGKAGSGPKKGDYLEFAIAPGFSAGPVAFTVPLTIGTGFNKFYAKDGFGYFSAGLNAAYTLPVSKTYGTWTATAGVTYYNTERKATLNASSDDVVASAGLGVAF